MSQSNGAFMPYSFQMPIQLHRELEKIGSEHGLTTSQMFQRGLQLFLLALEAQTSGGESEMTLRRGSEEPHQLDVLSVDMDALWGPDSQEEDLS